MQVETVGFKYIFPLSDTAWQSII